MSIPEAIATTHDRTDRATSAYDRTDSVYLKLAVKIRTPKECRTAAAALCEAGLPILLGHDRVQEAHATAEAIREMPGARIHLIGSLQSNRINHALTCVDAAESLDPPALASKIDACTTGTLPMSVEVNVPGEATKHGCAPADVSVLVDVVGASAHLQLAGFMTVGLNSPVETDVRATYAQLRGIRDEAAAHLGINESDLALSMGMSRGLEWAIAEGATTVRLGTAIFDAHHVRVDRWLAPTRHQVGLSP